MMHTFRLKQNHLLPLYLLSFLVALIVINCESESKFVIERKTQSQTQQDQIQQDQTQQDQTQQSDNLAGKGCSKEGEKRACYSGSPSTRNVGICKDGEQTCLDGKWTECKGEVLPTSEVCSDNLDNDCDGTKDEKEGSIVVYKDLDGDGFGGGISETVSDCTVPQGYSEKTGDCNDADGSINPGAQEICNGKDDNCNGKTDEGDNKYYEDNDSDGYGNPSKPVYSLCEQHPSGTTSDASDCDDSKSSVNPSVEEICDNIDNNCNGQIDENCIAYSNYSYRAPVTVSTQVSISGYPVLLTLDTKTLIQNGKMRPDCRDILFYYSPSVIIYYWLQGGCNTQNTKIWFKVHYLPANSADVFWIYYGYPDEISSHSNYAKTIEEVLTNTKNAKLPSGRHGLSCASGSNNKIYCFGGYDGSRLDQIVVYDYFNDSLTIKSSTLPSGRHGLSCASASNDRIYCFGGDYAGELDQIVEYDYYNDSLAIKSSKLPSGRNSLSCASDSNNKKIYCFGGYYSYYSNEYYLDQVVEYRWRKVVEPEPEVILGAEEKLK